MARGAERGQLQLFDPRSREPEFEVRISRRARRLTVRVYPGGRVQVTVPAGMTPHAVERFVVRHRAWIDARVAEFRLRPAPDRHPLPTELELRALGERWSVDFRPRARGGWSEVRPGQLLIHADPADVPRARESLRVWLGDRGRRALEPWLDRESAATGLQYERVQIRRQRTRWGSCSRAGTISLNVSLLFQPPAVVRYLLVHELCHTRHMNHSARFWRLVEQHEPEWRSLDRVLGQGWREVPDWVYA
ncbi:MAG: SprT family zinc-dependent metalloprotease [Steroidobacteraceae bacterium]|nr:SprT family zinc-dependent metalloprotease [Steroidobacteraceae bacterium]